MNEYINHSIDNLQELIQDDLICLLDGYPDELVDKVCQIVVDRVGNFRNIIRDISP